MPGWAISPGDTSLIICDHCQQIYCVIFVSFCLANEELRHRADSRVYSISRLLGQRKMGGPTLMDNNTVVGRVLIGRKTIMMQEHKTLYIALSLVFSPAITFHHPPTTPIWLYFPYPIFGDIY